MCQDDEDLMISPVKLIEFDRPHRGKQNVPSAPAPYNVENSRAYGSGFGSNHRAPAVTPVVCSIGFKLH